jgi:hypothetical protein
MPHQGNTRWQLGIQHITQSEQKSTFKLGIFLNTKSGSRHRVSEHCVKSHGYWLKNKTTTV